MHPEYSLCLSLSLSLTIYRSEYPLISSHSVVWLCWNIAVEWNCLNDSGEGKVKVTEFLLIVFIYKSAPKRSHTHTQTHTNTHKQTHKQKNTHTHTHTHTHKHTHTHTTRNIKAEFHWL